MLHLLTSPLALRVVPCLAQKSVAIGGGADMDDRAAMDDGDVNDVVDGARSQQRDALG